MGTKTIVQKEGTHRTQQQQQQQQNRRYRGNDICDRWTPISVFEHITTCSAFTVGHLTVPISSTSDIKSPIYLNLTQNTDHSSTLCAVHPCKGMASI